MNWGIDVLCKKLWGKTPFLMSKFNLELFKTLILNFACIHSKRRKLGMFILFQKCQFIYRNKVISPPIRQFPSFSIFGHVTIFKRQGSRKPQDLLLEKSSTCSRSPSGKYSQLCIICSEHIFDPGLKVARAYLFARWLCFWIAFFGRNSLTDFYDFWHP